MAKKRQETSPTGEPSAKPVKKSPVKKRAAVELPWHPVWRWSVSLLVFVHLLAVFSAPWKLSTNFALPPGYEAMQPPRPLPPPESVVWQEPIVAHGVHRFFHHYLNLLYLNHGYEFFAPDPAGTHVIDYQVNQADGNVVEGRMPSHELHWPRLLYHRYMMLTEQTQLLGPESAPLYAGYLATIYQGTSHLQLKIHYLLSPQRVADDTPLDAPSTYGTIGEIAGQPRVNTATNELPTGGEAPISIPGAQP